MPRDETPCFHATPFLVSAPRLLPAAVPLPQGVVVRSVHAGPDCSAVVSTAGELLLTGDNSSGKLTPWPHKGLRTNLPVSTSVPHAQLGPSCRTRGVVTRRGVRSSCSFPRLPFQSWLGGAGRGPWLRFRAVNLRDKEPVRDVHLSQRHSVVVTETGRLVTLGDAVRHAVPAENTFAVSDNHAGCHLNCPLPSSQAPSSADGERRP